MSPLLSWKWLCSRPDFRHRPIPGRARRCLAAVEQLEDRVLLTATAPVPLSHTSAHAVESFLKLEHKLVGGQTDAIKLEADVIELKTQSLSAAAVDYFLKIDRDMLQIDNDLIGAAGSAGAAGTGGIDGILTGLALPAKVASDLESRLIPAVESAREATIAVIGKLEKLAAGTQGIQSASAVDWWLKIPRVVESAARDFTLSFAKIEHDFIGADAKDLGPALGLQGAPAAGPAGALLEDLAVLTADAAPPSDLNGDHQVEAFIKYATHFLGGEDEYLRKKLPGKMKSGQITVTRAEYFLKIDADLVQMDNDLAGSPATSTSAGTTATPVGVANVLLNDAKTLGLSPQTVGKLEALVKAAQAAGAEAAAQEQEILKIFGNLGDGGFLADKGKGGIGAASDLFTGVGWSFGLEIDGMEDSLIKLDPNLGPSLGSSTGTTAPGPLGGLLQDSLVLVSDVGGKLPGASR